MPFIRIGGVTRKGTDPDSISMSASDTKTGAIIQIYFGSDILADAGFDTPKCIVAALEGVEEDKGTMLIERASKGYTLYQQPNSTTSMLRIPLAKVTHYEVDPLPGLFTAVQFSMDKQTGVLIALPKWLVYKAKPVAPKLVRGMRV